MTNDKSQRMLQDAIATAKSYDARGDAHMRNHTLTQAYECGMPIAYIDEALSNAGFAFFVRLQGR